MPKLFDDQSRWDDYGLKQLQAIQAHPERHIIVNSPIGHWNFYNDLLQHLMPLENKSVLELGCGLGHLSVYFSKLGGKMYGVDIGESIVAAAKALAQVNQVNCEFSQCDVLKLPFEDHAYDVVFGISILHHLSPEDVTQVLRETARVLKPDGFAIFVEPVENSQLFGTLQNLIPLGKPGAWGYRPSILNRPAWKRYLATLDDRDMTVRELKDAGAAFSTVQVQNYGFLSRLQRITGPKYRNSLIALDAFLFKHFPPLRFYCQMVLVKYCKKNSAGWKLK